MTEWIQVAGGGLLLYFGAEWFVGGASGLALALRVPKLLVGLTVVAYGTSAPELIVGVQAASAGHGEVALANVIGSNVANIGLILGGAALIKPAHVDGALCRRELPMLLASAAAIPLVLIDGVIHPLEGVALLLVAISYSVFMVRAARGASSLARAVDRESVAGDAADVASAPKPARALRALVIAVGGLTILLFGGSMFVEGAVSVAKAYGMSDRLVGLTIVAIGTSLPELVTSVVAALRGHSDLAVGNVVGSNVFNTFLCLGAASLAGSVGAPLGSLWLDICALLVSTSVAALYIRRERFVSRGEGAVALLLYLAFMALAIRGG